MKIRLPRNTAAPGDYLLTVLVDSTWAHLWLQVNNTADHGSCELIVDSVQLESSPSVLSSVETVANLVFLVLLSVRRPAKPRNIDKDPAVTRAVCVQATNLNVFLCCDNSGQLFITTSMAADDIWRFVLYVVKIVCKIITFWSLFSTLFSSSLIRPTLFRDHTGFDIYIGVKLKQSLGFPQIKNFSHYFSFTDLAKIFLFH